MSLVNTRAAFEKAVRDAVVAADNTVKVFYDNTAHAVPGKNTKYVEISMDLTDSTFQGHGEAQPYYAGSIRCNVYIPRGKGSAVLSAITESVIDGLTSVNVPSYVDTFTCTPRVSEIRGPITVDLPESSHYLGVVSCSFSAND